jgi:glycosyltransferase involved in cell wall biosynthesis
VGRLVPGKGLLELLTMLSHNNFEGNFNILGDGVLLAELSKFKYSKGMNVKFFGWCDDETISHFLDQADVMIFPSWSDEWGLAVVEAINMGTPVLGSIRSGAVEELVIEGFTGFRFDPEKEDSVMNAFRHFQYLDRRVHQTLKQNCFTFSREKNLTAENMAHQFNLAIQSVIK